MFVKSFLSFQKQVVESLQTQLLELNGLYLNPCLTTYKGTLSNLSGPHFLNLRNRNNKVPALRW